MSQLWMDSDASVKGPAEGNEHWYLQQRTHEAALCCERVAQSEVLLGYDDSAQMYRELATEIREAGAWWLSQRTDVERYHGMFVPAPLRGAVA
jgi:hypothetical protein